MAQTNFTPIYLYNSGMANNTPLAANLGAGELAINYTDGKLFYKDNSSVIQVIGWKTTPTTAGGTGLTSYTAGDLPYYSSGTTLSKLGIGTNGYVLESNGSAPTWVAQSTLSVGSATNATNTAITDNTSSSATWYPTIVSATTGNLQQTTSSTKLSFVPNTGTLTTSYLTPTNPLGYAYGGTGLTSTPSNGQFDIGNGSGFTRTTLTAGSGISVTNGSGSITVANTQNTAPLIRVYSSGNTSCAQNVATKIALNNAQYDTNSNFNTSTYRFTPTVGGYYQVNAVVAFLSYTASYVTLAIYKNGSAYSGFGSSYYAGTGIASFTTSDIVYLNGSTDYMELYVTQGTAGSLNANNAIMTAAMIRGT